MQLAKVLSGFEVRVAGDCVERTGMRRNLAVGLWAMCLSGLALATWMMRFPVIREKLNNVLVLAPRLRAGAASLPILIISCKESCPH